MVRTAARLPMCQQLTHLHDRLPARRAFAGWARKQHVCAAPAVAPVPALHQHTRRLLVVADGAQPLVVVMYILPCVCCIDRAG